MSVKKKDAINFTQLNEELGGFGKYQKFVFILGGLVVFMPAMAVVNIIFLGKEMPYRCLIPECEDIGNSTYQDDFLNFTTPLNDENSWAKCKSFRTVDTRDETCTFSNFNPHMNKSCSQYVHDNSILKSTIVMDFSLVCENSWLQPLSNSAFMIGMLLGACTLGDLADRIGRKKGLLVALTIMSIGSFLSCASNSYYMFLVTRLIMGIGSVAMFAVPFILVLEFVPASYRNFCGIFIEIPFALGEAFVAFFAYFIRDWRYLQLACAVLPLILYSYYWIMPESIRWLVSKNRYKEAKKIIEKIEKVNKCKVSSEIHHILDNPPTPLTEFKEGSSSSEVNVTVEKRSVFDLFRYRNLRYRTLNLMFCWVVVNLSYYGLNSNSANLGGDIFVNFVAIMLIEIPSYIFSYLILDRIGRKWSLVVTFLMGGIACLVSGILPASMKSTIVTLSMIGKFGAAAAFAIIYVYTAEIFPTSMRSLGVGSCSMASRMGGILAPFIADLSKIYKPLPLLVFGVLGISAGFSILFLPETYGSELPQTIQESEDFGKDQPILYCVCRKNKKKANITN